MFFLLLVPQTHAFCEMDWKIRANITNINQHKMIGYTHEYENAISSLVYTLFGLIGLIQKYNTGAYYLVMHSFILCGITSFCHHYFCCNTDWARGSDVICMELLASVSLFYIINGIKIPYRIINRTLELLCMTANMLMLVYHNIGYGPRGEIFKCVIGAIVGTQVYICSNLFYTRSTFSFKVLVSSIINIILFSLGVIFWYIDFECPRWIWRSVNGHLIWHVFVSWSLFNTINITCLFHAIQRNTNFKWITPHYRMSFLIFIIILQKKLTINNSHFELQRLVISPKNKTHRRARTFG